MATRHVRRPPSAARPGTKRLRARRRRADHVAGEAMGFGAGADLTEQAAFVIRLSDIQLGVAIPASGRDEHGFRSTPWHLVLRSFASAGSQVPTISLMIRPPPRSSLFPSTTLFC